MKAFITAKKQACLALVTMIVMMGITMPAWAETKSSPENIKTSTNDSQQIMAMTSKFYDDYLKFNDTLDDGNYSDTALVQFLQKSGVVEKQFIDKIDKFIKESLAEVGFVEVNPIVWAQDVPLGVKVSQPKIDGNKATINVYTLWSDTEKYLLVVKLIKTKDGWKIYDIIDGEM